MKGEFKVKVVSAQLDMFIYPTENKERALRALMNLIPQDLRERVPIERSSFKSHYGYSLEKASVKLIGKDARALISHLESMMDEETAEEISRTLEMRTDDRNLYIRVNKQDAFEGRIKLHGRDPGGQIRIKITYFGYLPKGGLIRAIRERGIGITR